MILLKIVTRIEQQSTWKACTITWSIWNQTKNEGLRPISLGNVPFCLGVEAKHVKRILYEHIPKQTAFFVKSIGCFTYMKRLCFPFDKVNENFGQEMEKTRVGPTSNCVAEAYLCYQGDHSYRLMLNTLVIRSLNSEISKSWISVLARIQMFHETSPCSQTFPQNYPEPYGWSIKIPTI